MATWDQPGATWDSGLRYDQISPPPVNPKPSKHTRMKRQVFFPSRMGDQVVWLGNFKNKLPGYATALGLTTTQLDAIILDVENALYALDDYRGALTPANTSCHQCIQDALYDDSVPGDIAWMGFTPPAGAPAAVPYGCLKRVFAAINDDIKTAPAYTVMMGEDLGTEGPEEPAPSPTIVPELELRATTGGKLEVLWTKKQFDGLKLDFDLGGGVMQSDIDLRPNYTLNWLPAAGQSAVIKVRARYLYKGEEYGNWSDWQPWTLTGV